MSAIATSGTYYVSVTSLLLKSFLMAPKFMYYTSPAFREAAVAPGNLLCTTAGYNGLQMTITVWESKDKMREYYMGGAHAAAMKQLKSISSYAKIHGYFTDEMPTDASAIEEWKVRGRVVHGDPNPLFGDQLAIDQRIK
uniref:DUF3291 domain-containing protein n=1 Tax=Proboscia inermis TaxID=420281 RepID=A0A7S0C1U5_9STRA|mmetsp:Transcript_22229/g.22541  ORF Transcript_22229/g.22541 Transcript_22229/m.22541 type:complete len:139 (+) Transcript_22229:91-507(+)